MKVKTNPYSVPAAVGTCVEARLGSAHVEVWAEGKCLARHERSLRAVPGGPRSGALPRRAGAQARCARRRSKPLEQWRARGLWPASYDALWAHLIDRHGKQAGTRR